MEEEIDSLKKQFTLLIEYNNSLYATNNNLLGFLTLCNQFFTKLKFLKDQFCKKYNIFNENFNDNLSNNEKYLNISNYLILNLNNKI